MAAVNRSAVRRAVYFVLLLMEGALAGLGLVVVILVLLGRAA